MIYIIPDTNFLKVSFDKENTDYTKFYLNNFDKLNKLRRININNQEIIITIPDLVCKEIHQHKYEAYKDVCQKANEIFNCLGDYGKAEIYLNTEQYAEELYKQMNSYIEENQITVIPICENLWFESIVDRAVKKLPPFLGRKKESDKGFKDVIIWYSLLSFARRNPGEYFFITNDNIFHQEYKLLKNEFYDETGSKIYIFREYQEVVQHILAIEPTKNIDSVNINTDIREIVLRHSDESNIVKLKYIQPKVFAEEDVLTFINEDIKRIYDDAYMWWDSTDLGSEKYNFAYQGTMDYNVTYNGGGLLAFLFEGNIFLGGPHGTPTQMGRVYELSTGKVLGLCELLDLDEETIINLVLDKWKEDKEKRGNNVYWDNFYPKYDKVDDIKFYMDDCGIHVFFDIYEAACYADGFVEFLLVDEYHIPVLKEPAKG